MLNGVLRCEHQERLRQRAGERCCARPDAVRYHDREQRSAVVRVALILVLACLADVLFQAFADKVVQSVTRSRR